eukprot:1161395-Pelagomonas_calceolata.AAC.4
MSKLARKMTRHRANKMSTGTALHAPLYQTQTAERINFFEDYKMIYVEWHHKWEAAIMLQMHPDLDAHVQAFEEENRNKSRSPGR